MTFAFTSSAYQSAAVRSGDIDWPMVITEIGRQSTGANSITGYFRSTIDIADGYTQLASFLFIVSMIIPASADENDVSCSDKFVTNFCGFATRKNY